MPRLLTLSNGTIQVNINKTGAELCGIKLLSNGMDYMWDANPQIWKGYAPVLFPIIGALKDNSYILEGKTYSLPKHGFIRNNQDIEIESKSDNCITFILRYNEKTLLQYPFKFEFLISYILRENQIIIDHEVKNLEDKHELYFSLGAHPAFKCPIDPGEQYTDYYLEFEHPETAHTYRIDPSGLIGEKGGLMLDNSNKIKLHYSIFDKDALVFKDHTSRNVSLTSKISGKRIEVKFEGFPYLGIWAKPNADFVCIEPWLGIADSTDTNQDIKTKEGIIKLNAQSSFKASYSIGVF